MSYELYFIPCLIYNNYSSSTKYLNGHVKIKKIIIINKYFILHIYEYTLCLSGIDRADQTYRRPSLLEINSSAESPASVCSCTDQFFFFFLWSPNQNINRAIAGIDTLN